MTVLAIPVPARATALKGTLAIASAGDVRYASGT
jgi:hypothetical protein